MFWHDISEIKEWMVTIASRLTEMQMKHLENEDNENDYEDSLDRLHDKLTTLLNDSNREKQVFLAEKTLDKFEDYMKNVDKLNQMINEFKGCISIARAAISDKKEMDDIRNTLKSMIETCHKYFNHQKTISDQYFKIDAIYKKLCEEKPKIPKKKVIRKKKVTSASSE